MTGLEIALVVVAFLIAVCALTSIFARWQIARWEDGTPLTMCERCHGAGVIVDTTGRGAPFKPVKRRCDFCAGS